MHLPLVHWKRSPEQAVEGRGEMGLEWGGIGVEWGWDVGGMGVE